MRERKYRAWDKDEEKMLSWLATGEGYFLVDNWSDPRWTSGHYISLGEALLDDDRFIVMDYIGLKDKTGIEIFEGDILRWTIFSREDDSCCSEVGHVAYIAPNFIIIDVDGDKTWFGQPDEIEKIGNVHENPELLAKNQDRE